MIYDIINQHTYDNTFYNIYVYIYIWYDTKAIIMISYDMLWYIVG